MRVNRTARSTRPQELRFGKKFGCQMKPVCQFLAGSVLLMLLSGCGMTTSRTSVGRGAFEWNELGDSMEHARHSSNKDTLVFAFTADWSPASGPLFRRELQDHEVTSFLAGRSVKGYLVNCTATNSPGWAAIEKYGMDAAPVSIAIWHQDGVIRFVRPPAITAQGIITAIAPHIP